MSAYARSCQQYVAVQQNLVPPDIFRLRCRLALGEVVAAIVRGDEAATDTTVSARTPPSVLEVDRAHFVTLVPLRAAMWGSSGKTWLDGA